MSWHVPMRIGGRDSDGCLYTGVRGSKTHRILGVDSPSVHQQMRDKQNAVNATEYYSALKRNKVLTRTKTQMDFEDVMLSDINQMQKVKYCVIPLMWDA